MQAIGHNNPPSDEELFAQRMAEGHTQLLEEADRLARAKAKPCDSDDYAERLTNYIKRINVTVTSLEKLRVNEKAPILKQGKVIDGYFKTITDTLEQRKREANKPLSDWLRHKAEEEQRLRREAAEKIRKDAEEKAAEAARLAAESKQEEAVAAQQSAERIEAHAINMHASAETLTADMAQIKSDKGGSASLRTRWVGTITARAELDLEQLRPHLKLEHLQSALNAFVAAGGRDIAGAKIEQISESVVR